MSDHDGTPRGDAEQEAVARAEVMYALGYTPVELDQDGYVRDNHEAEVIHVLIYPDRIGTLSGAWAREDGGRHGSEWELYQLGHRKGWQP